MAERRVTRPEARRRIPPQHRTLQSAALALLDILEKPKNQALFALPELNPFEPYQGTVFRGTKELHLLTGMTKTALEMAAPMAKPGKEHWSPSRIAAEQATIAAALHNRLDCYKLVAEEYQTKIGKNPELQTLCDKLAALSENFKALGSPQPRHPLL